MSELSNIEELKKRREQLLLEQEVARLERKQKLGKAGGWSWIWVAPLTIVAAFFVLVGLVEGEAAALTLGLVGLVPVTMKVYFKRGD